MPETSTIPTHIAIVMDGNGRWAKAQGLKRSQGHKAGTEAALNIVTHCRELGVAHLTLYTFSTENWKRPEEEKKVLFDLLVQFLTRELPTLIKNDVQLRVLGDYDAFPFAVRQVLKLVLGKTRDCKSMILNLALNYGGRDEIVRAAQRIVAKGFKPEEITAETFSDQLYTVGQPDPDLVIRTSGEYRLSNYLLWQSAYSEFYFTDTHWPDFTPAELDKALESYAGRQRRFGKTGEQVES
ncbi:MAG: isoprenyl transferase [Proteobacteria bacterium]|nr:isoprenyl transferase [Pseudomonadota bacterium]